MAELKAAVSLLFRDLLSPGLTSAASKITGAADAIGGGAAHMASGSAAAARTMDAAADSMGAGFSGAARTIDAASDRIGDDLTAAARRVDAASDRMADGAERVTRSWRALDLASDLSQVSGEVTQLAAGLQRLAEAPAAVATAYESGTARVRTVLTAEDIEGGAAAAIREAGERLASGWQVAGGTVSLGEAEFLDMVYSGRSAGLSVDAAIAAAAPAAELALATGGTNEGASKAMIATFSAFGEAGGDPVAEMQRIAGSLAATQETFALENLAQLTDGLKNVAGTAIAFDIPLDTVNAALGTLNTLGITGPEAGTALKSAIVTIGPAAEKLGFEIQRTDDGAVDLVATLREIEAQGYSAEQLAAAFGSEAGPAVSLLTAKLELMTGGLENVGRGFEVTQENAAIMANTLEQRQKNLADSLGIFQKRLGAGSLAVRRFGVDLAATGVDLLNWVTALPMVGEGLAAVAGGALQVASAGATGAAGVLEMSTGLLSAATLLGRSSPFTKQLADGTLVTPLQRLGGVAARTGGAIGRAFGSAGRIVGSAAGTIGAGIGRIAAGFGPMIAGALTSIPINFTWAASMWAAVWPILAVIAAVALVAAGVYLVVRNWEAIASWFADLWQRILKPFRAAWDWIQGLFGGGGKKLPETAAAGMGDSAGTFGTATAAMVGEADPLLPSSDAERGPLSRLTAAGRAIPATISAGMLAASPVLAAGLPAALGPGGALDGLAADYPAAPLEMAPAYAAPGGGPRAEAAGGRDLVRVLQELTFELRAQRTGRSPAALRSAAAGAARQVRVDQLDVRLDETGDLLRVLEGLAEAAGEPL